MDQQPQTYRFTWQGIEVEVTYIPRRWKVIDHLAIRSTKPEHAPLPITRTGYLSHFIQPGTIEAHGGDVVAQVIAWLDEEAAKSEWPWHLEAQRQRIMAFRGRPATWRGNGAESRESSIICAQKVHRRLSPFFLII